MKREKLLELAERCNDVMSDAHSQLYSAGDLAFDLAEIMQELLKALVEMEKNDDHTK